MYEARGAHNTILSVDTVKDLNKKDSSLRHRGEVQFYAVQSGSGTP